MTEWKRLSREALARRVAKDIPPGAVINLGIGMPELVGNYLQASDDIVVHCENGIVGSGPIVPDEISDLDLINAGRKPVALAAGGHFVDHVDSFSIVRGGHLDITVMGAFQVSAGGDLANWSTGDLAALPSPGGAMDLAVGARQVFAMMNLFDRQGNPRLVKQCTLPLTAMHVVSRLYTDLAVFDLTADTPVVLDLAEGLTIAALAEKLDMVITHSTDVVD